MKIGQRIAAKPNTLAYICGDRSGRIEEIEGEAFLVRMDQSGRLVPFRADQLAPPAGQSDAVPSKQQTGE